MTYTSLEFLLLLPAAWGLYRLIPDHGKLLFLLFLSYGFYLTWSPPGAVLMAAVTVLTFFSAAYIEKTREAKTSALVALTVVAILVAYLMAFKVALVTPAHGIWGLIMPVGLSYYTFKLIGYVLDVHWGKIAASRRIAPFATYIAFFPQIVAGPIQMADDFFRQLPPTAGRLSDGLPRIAWGLTKKLLIADNLGLAVNWVYAHVTGLHGAPLWLGFYLFPLQLYADFSGLTDIAIGTGRLFGITGPENFNRPYTATSITDYWRRWHMSLTNWLRNYVFTPLSIATRAAGRLGLAFSLTVNMVLIGLWHGLTAGYLVFGLINSAYLVTDALSLRRRNRFFKRNPHWNAGANWLGWLITFHLIAVAMVFFRAPRVSEALWLLRHLWSRDGTLQNLINDVGVRSLVAGLLGYAILEIGERFRPDLQAIRVYAIAPRWARWSFASAGAVILVFAFCLYLVHSTGARSPFIYEIF